MSYGVRECNPLPEGYHKEVTEQINRTVDWTTPGLYIVRLRLLSDPGFPVWDVSYCHGRIGTEMVNVSLPFDQLPRKGMVKAIVEYAKRDKVYARGLGILDNISTLL